jgi:hypothetical protein
MFEKVKTVKTVTTNPEARSDDFSHQNDLTPDFSDILLVLDIVTNFFTPHAKHFRS